MNRYRYLALPAALLLLVATVLYLYFFMPIFVGDKPVCILVKPGESFKVLTKRLQRHSKLSFPLWLNWYGKLSGQSKAIKAGEYCFTNGVSPIGVLSAVTHGDVQQRKFTIIEGWTLQAVKKSLAIHQGMVHQLAELEDSELALKVKSSGDLLGAQGSLEGEFFPDTYRYRYPDSDLDILKRAHQRLLQKLQLAWQQRDKSIPYKSVYEALIAASIIEQESAISSDRRLISGVIVNRLRKHMRLQVDPTVRYGLSEAVRLDRQALRTDTPYNTYMHSGLPPTPICMPSEDAIQAAMHPEKTAYLYFVAKGDGYHQFSTTLREQRAAIQKYIFRK